MKIQLFLTSILIHIMVLSSAEIASSPVIVQPGQPGSASKIIDAQTAINIADTSYTFDDVLFCSK